MASPEKIDEVIQRIIANYDPDEILLFGSHANAKAAESSDLDLLVIKDTDEPLPRRVRRLEHLLHGMLLRFDIKIYTRAELHRAMEHPYSLVSRIVTRQAKTVYSKRFPDYGAILRAWEREPSTDRHCRLKDNASEWRLFQLLYERERARWTVRPCDVIARRVEGTSAKTIADLGCGDMRLAERLGGRDVLSIDHIAPSPEAVAADIAATPLKADSMEAAVLSLALIGTNWRDYLVEAHRILRPDGRLYVAEPLRRAGEAAFRLLDALEAVGFSIDGDVRSENGIVYATAMKPVGKECRSLGLGSQRSAIRIIFRHVSLCRWLRRRTQRSPVPEQLVVEGVEGANLVGTA